MQTFSLLDFLKPLLGVAPTPKAEEGATDKETGESKTNPPPLDEPASHENPSVGTLAYQSFFDRHEQEAKRRKKRP